MRNNHFAFVCTNYNNSHFTRDFVFSIVSAEYFDNSRHKIVVVDNSDNESEYENLKLILEIYPFVVVIRPEVNLGYFRGLNEGIKFIRKMFPEINNILIGNNDLKIKSDFFRSLEHIVDLLDKYPVIAPDIITLDGIHQNPHVKDKVSWFKLLILDVYYSNYNLGKFMFSINKIIFRFFRKSDVDHQFEGEILQGYGACYILSRVFFDNFAILDAPTFLMGEEAFLSLQIKKIGYYPYYTNKIKISHIDHATVSKVDSYLFWKISSESHRIYRELTPFNWKKV
jgi:GT2 family glycosyltransferase